MRDDGADGRIVHDRVGHARRVHEHATAVVIAFVRAQRANDGQVFHLLGNGRQKLANLNAVGAGRDGFEFAAGRFARLQVPHVDGRRAAAQPENDEALVVLLKVRGVGRNPRKNCMPGNASADRPAKCFKKCLRSDQA